MVTEGRQYGEGAVGAMVLWDRDRWGGKFAWAPGGVTRDRRPADHRGVGVPHGRLRPGPALVSVGVLGLALTPVRVEGGPKVRGTTSSTPRRASMATGQRVLLPGRLAHRRRVQRRDRRHPRPGTDPRLDLDPLRGQRNPERRPVVPAELTHAAGTQLVAGNTAASALRAWYRAKATSRVKCMRSRPRCGPRDERWTTPRTRGSGPRATRTRRARASASRLRSASSAPCTRCRARP